MSMSRALAFASLLIAPALAVACGSSSSNPVGPTSGDAGNPGNGGSSSSGGGSGGSSSGGVVTTTDGGTSQTAAHAPFPTVTNHGVPAMTSPKIVAVTFNNDTNAAALGTFVSTVGASSWWQTVTKEYGIGAATGSSVAVTATLEPSYTDDPSATLPDGGTPTFPAFVSNTVATAPGMPKPDANTIYVFFLPASSSVTLQGQTTCVGAGGYHKSASAGGQEIYYAVVNECAGAKLGDRAFPSELDYLTFAGSHEIIEAATDPSIATTAIGITAGYYNDWVDNIPDDLAWNVFSDGEVADFCVDQFGLTTQHDTTTAGSNTVQRIWSVAAAKAGTNPCIPVPSGEVYFNAAPAEGSDVLIVPDKNVATTIEVDAFSDGPKTWQLLAFDGSQGQTGAAALTMSFVGGTTETETGLTLPPQPAISVSNGTKVQLSVTLTASLSTSNPLALGILISHDGTSLLPAPNNHYWPFIVTTQAIAKQVGLTNLTPGPIHRANVLRGLQGLRAAN